MRHFHENNRWSCHLRCIQKFFEIFVIEKSPFITSIEVRDLYDTFPSDKQRIKYKQIFKANLKSYKENMNISSILQWLDRRRKTETMQGRRYNSSVIKALNDVERVILYNSKEYLQEILRLLDINYFLTEN